MVRVPALSEAKFMLYSALRAAGIRNIRAGKASPLLTEPGEPVAGYPA